MHLDKLKSKFFAIHYLNVKVKPIRTIKKDDEIINDQIK